MFQSYSPMGLLYVSKSLAYWCTLCFKITRLLACFMFQNYSPMAYFMFQNNSPTGVLYVSKLLAHWRTLCFKSTRLWCTLSFKSTRLLVYTVFLSYSPIGVPYVPVELIISASSIYSLCLRQAVTRWWWCYTDGWWRVLTWKYDWCTSWLGRLIVW